MTEGMSFENDAVLTFPKHISKSDNSDDVIKTNIMMQFFLNHKCC